MNISDANIRNMLKAISAGNHVLNENIRLYKHTESDCPDCSYDPIRKESTNQNCPTCDGKGVIIVNTYNEISASIEQEGDLKYDFTNAGIITKGQIFATIDIQEINDILNSNSTFDLNDYTQMQKFIKQYDYILWKGAKYSVEHFEPGWLQGNLYEIALTLSLMS